MAWGRSVKTQQNPANDWLVIRPGAARGKRVRVLVAKNMAHTRTRNNFQRATTHPNAETDFKIFATPDIHLLPEAQINKEMRA